MKKHGWLFMAIVCLIVMSPVGAWASDVAVTQPPEWLGTILGFLQNLPYVGPILVIILKWTGVITTVFTALSVMIQAILTIPEIIARWAGAQKAADLIKKYSDMILPYLQYLSVFNVQKKQG